MNAIMCKECESKDCLHMLSAEELDAIADRLFGDIERGIPGDEDVPAHYKRRLEIQRAEWAKYWNGATLDAGPRDPEVIEECEQAGVEEEAG